MSISLFSTWAVGALSGYSLKDNDLPTGYKYGTMALTTGIHIVKSLANVDLQPYRTRPGSLVMGLFVGIPLMVGSTFCVGDFFGKSARHVVDLNKKNLLE